MFDNTRQPLDSAGEVLHSHGGHILAHEGYYYLYGEDRRAGLKVSVYRSRDLREWEYRGTALSIDSPVVGHPLTRNDRRLRNPQEQPGKTWNLGVTIERPKVLYNARTGKFVMWMHFEDGNNYRCAHAAVASCDRPDGEFVYHGSFRPCGEMSRDCTLFQDDDGRAYFISASRDNADLHIYRLSADYLSIDVMIGSYFPQQYREAPALFKRNGVYFLISSECTGWEPNQGRYSWARSIGGPWAEQRPFGSPTTFDTQPAFVLEVPGTEGKRYLYVGDRWDPTEYFHSRYIVLPLEFPDDTQLRMEWRDQVSLDAATGRTASEPGAEPLLFRVASRNTMDYLRLPPDARPGDSVGSKRLDYQDEGMLFRLETAEGGKSRVVGAAGGLALAARGDRVVAARQDEEDPAQLWTVEDRAEGLKVLRACDGRLMTAEGGGHSCCEMVLREEERWFDTEWGHSPQGFLLAAAYGREPARR